MKRNVLFSLSLLAIITLSSASAFANDAVFGGSGADLAPLEEKTLKMASEDILIEEVGPKGKWITSHWEIKATYVFENPSDTTKTTTFGFPEATCDPEESPCNVRDEKRDNTFYNMKTTVDGKKVKVKLGKVAADNKWAPELGRVHLFEVKVPAKSKITVVHQYEMGMSGSFMQDTSLYYITRTGALWNGPIGSARFTIRVKDRPWGFHYPETYDLEAFTTRKDGKQFETEIVFAMKDWTPTQDLALTLGSDYITHKKCPSILMHADALLDEKGGIDLAYAKQTFEDLSKEDLRMCRNIPYAHHGYTFKDKRLDEFFYPKSISEPATKSNWSSLGQLGLDKEKHRVVTFAKSANYSAEMLSKSELTYIKAIKAVEKSRE